VVLSDLHSDIPGALSDIERAGLLRDKAQSWA
jgi:hypothetical protein